MLKYVLLGIVYCIAMGAIVLVLTRDSNLAIAVTVLVAALKDLP